MNIFRIKKANYISEELSKLHLIVLLISFFTLLLWITAGNRTKMNKLFIWTTNSGGAQHHKHANCTWLFISKCNNAINNCCILSDCRNSFNKKLKTYGQAKDFFNPTNTKSLSEWSLKEKLHTFIGMTCYLFTWFNMQILNLCYGWHRLIHNPLNYLIWRVFPK